jgi:alpha-ketoglutarate-dependent taurine dioxygenase
VRRTFRFLLVILAIAVSTGAHAAEQLPLFGAQLTYTNPNPQVWHKDEERRESAKGLLALKHVGLSDTGGNTTYPVLVIIYEQLPGPAQSLEDFTRMARQRAFFPTDDIITENDRIIYFCRYTLDTSHDLVIAHFLFEGNGVQVMGDAPTTLYGEVEGDFKQFIDSIHFQKSSAQQPTE